MGMLPLNARISAVSLQSKHSNDSDTSWCRDIADLLASPAETGWKESSSEHRSSSLGAYPKLSSKSLRLLPHIPQEKSKAMVNI